MNETELIEIKNTLNKLQEVLKGDEYGHEGLIARQKADEEFRTETLDMLTKLKEGQQLQQRLGENLEGRLSVIEDFFLFVRTITSVRRKTVIAIGTSLGLLGTLIAQFKEIAQFIKTLFPS